MQRVSFIIGVFFLCTTSVWAATLEIPGPGSTQSGIGVISGWKCRANGRLTVRFNGGTSIPLVYGSERSDVRDAGACSSANVGFVAIWNWGNLDGGRYTAVVYDNGQEFARSTFTVVSPGTEFLTNVSGSGEATLSNGLRARLEWDQAKQGFVVTEYIGGTGEDLGSFNPTFFHYEWAAPWGGPDYREVRDWLEPTYDLLLGVFGKTETIYPIELLRWGGPYIRLGENNGETTYQIALVSHEKQWMTFQFAHELAHALTNVFLNHPLQHRWFEETIADLAIMYVIQEYASETPYADFSETQWMELFREIDDERQASLTKRGIDPQNRVVSWFRDSYDEMRQNSIIRELNWAIAKELLPHFQANPGLWVALGYLNTWEAHLDVTFEEYLESWEDVLIEEVEDTELISILRQILYNQ